MFDAAFWSNLSPTQLEVKLSVLYSHFRSLFEMSKSPTSCTLRVIRLNIVIKSYDLCRQNNKQLFDGGMIFMTNDKPVEFAF